MNERQLNTRLGIGAVLVAAMLMMVAIPCWVSAPSNVSHMVLSPLFWPYTVSALLAIVGLGLILTALCLPKNTENLTKPIKSASQAYMRLVGIALIMLSAFWLFPRLGMVFTCMLVFLATAFLVKTRHPRIAVLCALTLPLILYLFFAHVAGVAIPQGLLLRLP